ncbi:MAG TPA: hypothetical protein VFO78_00725 [Candidatus Limnocylindrales bacterium]|nr:hypothetical protein [Candidatus Limnocylindrales bacterium]
MTRRRPACALLTAALAVVMVACSTAAPPAVSAGPGAPIEAARGLLAAAAARFELRVDRFKPGLPDEVVATAAGVVRPVEDAGELAYHFFPEVPADDPFRMDADIVWSAADVWVRLELDDEDDRWRHVTRERAPEVALIGRVQEEPLALVRFAAGSDPADVRPLSDAELGGAAAERWLVPVPADAARAAYVPPDSYLGFEAIFGVDELPLEIWLVDGRLARTGYVLEREEAPYGGPDRFETWYDWTAIGEPVAVQIPPSGEIVEIGEDEPVVSPSPG